MSGHSVAKEVRFPYGLATYLGVFLGQREAFARLRTMPTWGWAVIAGLELIAAGAYLGSATQISIAHYTAMSRIDDLPADQREQALNRINAIHAHAMLFRMTSAIVTPWLFWLIYAILFLIVGSVVGRAPSFRLAWAVATNAFAIVALGGLAEGVALKLHGTDAGHSGPGAPCARRYLTKFILSGPMPEN